MNLLEAITHSEAIARQLDSDWGVDGLDVPTTDRARLCAAMLDVSYEHHKAVRQLLHSGLLGSASALVRALYETTIRAVWLHRCATETEVSEFQHDDPKRFPLHIESLVKAIKKDVIDIEDMHKSIWPVLCSFAHSGYRQARFRVTPEEIAPCYTEDQQVEVLRFSDFILTLAARETFKLTAKPDLEQQWSQRIAQYLTAQTDQG